MPSFVAMTLADMLLDGRKAGMSRYAFLQCEQQRSQLIDYTGGCERIRNTPLARSSAILVRQFIFLFLVSLPLALIGEFSELHILQNIFGVAINDGVVLVPLFIMLLAIPLLSLDRIGMEQQNPFDLRRIDHLPLDAICHTIELNLLELLKNDSITSEQGIILDTLEISPEFAERIANSNNAKTLIS